MIKVILVKENKVQFNNGGIGKLENNILVEVFLNGKTIKATRLLKKYVVALEEYNNGQEELNIDEGSTLPMGLPLPQKQEEKEEKGLVVDDAIRVEGDEVFEGEEEKNSQFNFEGEWNFYNPMRPPVNQSYFNSFIDNFICQFKTIPNIDNYDIVINDNCRAKKIWIDTPMGKVQEKFNVFTMKVGSGNKEIDKEIMFNMACLMTMYLKPYGLVFDIENARYSDDELEVDMFIRNAKFKVMGISVGDLRKCVHIVYFLAKKEVKSQYRSYFLQCMQQQQKNA